eukprot:TRINITY_DN29413_c0_g1_i1.p1 TRINITY_DN29413_c0_g1~~TRINITY_DN29413_c0_g1_i1.p1  ORF type:complete len:304 (-),score=39.70 TRINITY_DN29413_c0_g1_i1:227-1138(-)
MMPVTRWCSVLLCLLAIGAHEKLVPSIPRAPPREVMIWVSEPSLRNSTFWQILMGILAHPSRRSLVHTVSPCVFAMADNGTLVFGDPDPALGGQAVLRVMVPKLRSLGFKVKPLVSGPPGGIEALVNGVLAHRERFVAEASEVMAQFDLDGLNLDVEISGNSSTGPLYNQLVTELSEAVHQRGGQVSSDICCDCDGDGGDYVGIRCQDYAAGPIDAVYTMSTYTNNSSQFETFIHSAARRLTAAKYGVGFEYNNVLSRVSMDSIRQLGVRRIALWCDVPEVYGYSSRDCATWWDAIEYFATTS